MYELNKELVNYVKSDVLPRYNEVDKGHGIEHIEYVIRRSLEFAKSVKDVDYDMVYVIASYHDLGNLVDRERHGEISAKMFLYDARMKEFFDDEQREIIRCAIEDHRMGLSGEKMYFEDKEYDKFLEDMNSLICDREKFKREFILANEKELD